jgi:Ca2+/Na+ antiporter
MGLTFLAAGTSVPDMLSAVIVAKQSKGDRNNMFIHINLSFCYAVLLS